MLYTRFDNNSSLELTNQQLEEEFNAPNAPTQFVYGQITYENPEVNKWIQLPALSTQDQLINYAVEHQDYELKHDKASGYYFIKFKNNIKSCLVNYILEPGKNRDVTLNKSTTSEHLDWISKLAFDKDGKLLDSREYQKLSKLDTSQRIQALADFCRFEQESSAADIEGNVIVVLNELMKQRSGVCRHRAQLFLALAREFDIDASLISNDVHQFVRVKNLDADFTLDLGGGEAQVIDLLMPPVRKSIADMAKKGEEDHEEKAKRTPLTPGNRFQTWNSLPIQATNAEELVEELSSPSRYSRHWLIFKDNHSLEALHQASCGKNLFFSPDLDSMVLQHRRIEQNKDLKVDSPVAQFLKNAQLNPNEAFTWFVNWSNPKARHVSLNSVIDNEDRHLDGLTIPPNVHIIVGMDERSAFKMGDDFYSRFDAISQVPELAPQTQPKVELNQPIHEEDVLFSSSFSWESILLGRHTFDEGTLDILPGALMKAVRDKTSKLTLHNAPWDDPKFRFFITELMRNKRFFFNGEWHALSPDFHIEFALPDLSTYPDILKPHAAPEETRVVNQTSFPLFFNQNIITKRHTIKPLPGFFAANQSLELVVSDYLTEIQWYSLLKEAKEQQCAITIKAAPKVFIPEPLREWVTPIEPLEQSNQLIISTDLDDAEEKYQQKDSITITIDPNTNFNNMFFHVSLKNKQFIGQETELLKAIKAGKPVILKGRFSTTLAHQLQSLFTTPPYLWVNGEAISVQNLTLISDNATPFKAIRQTIHSYKPETDFAKLNSILAEQLKKTYQQLRLTPCHSHFRDLPQDSSLQLKWLDNLTKSLEWRAGILPEGAEPTTPETVLAYLDEHSFAFLTSKTGSGKSYFVQKTLPLYGKKHGKPITIYHELAGIKHWLKHQGLSQPILFIDEANVTHEHYALFEALARGDKEFWYEGECYPLKNHKIIFAGNPTDYEGRSEPDLFKRFPNYLPFEGPRLHELLNPLLQQDEDAKSLLQLIETYYSKAQDAGLNITPRNAQMMCLRYFILKEFPQTKLMTDDFLMRYAILSEIKTISLDKKLSQDIRQDLKRIKTWKENKKLITEIIQQTQPNSNDKKFIWTTSRKKAAFSIGTLLLIREKKIKGQLDQELGINGIILEADPGLGKSQLARSILKAKGIDFVTILPTNPKEVHAKLLEAFHNGQMVLVEEFNTQIHEQLLNALLSGYDLEGKSPKKPGFCLIGTQNSTAFHGRQPLSQALDNRLMFIELGNYKLDELIEIVTEKFQLTTEEAQSLTQEYLTARDYAKTQGLFPQPNSRNLMKKAEEEQIKKETITGKAK